VRVIDFLRLTTLRGDDNPLLEENVGDEDCLLQQAARIAAQAADIARGNPEIWKQNKSFSELRRRCDWDKQIALSIDPRRAKQYRDLRSRNPAKSGINSVPIISGRKNAARPDKEISGCSMCGELCVYTLNDNQGV
jgi:thiamine biosynthesis protein ThiC